MAYRKISLSKGKVNIVDEADYDWLMQWKWCLNCNGYAIRTVKLNRARQKAVFMHRAIMSTPKELCVDHINGNPLDNRRSNLRNCTQQENLRNSIPRVTCTSKYKGVHWDGTRNKWMVRITISGIMKNLGRFDSEINAALIYNEAAKKYFGEFSRLNIIEGNYDRHIAITI